MSPAAPMWKGKDPKLPQEERAEQPPALHRTGQTTVIPPGCETPKKLEEPHISGVSRGQTHAPAARRPPRPRLSARRPSASPPLRRLPQRPPRALREAPLAPSRPVPSLPALRGRLRGPCPAKGRPRRAARRRQRPQRLSELRRAARSLLSASPPRAPSPGTWW